ncbi:MAG: hypothetical protein ACOX6T_13360 [Myxococcales bacterium]|jgi:hypothetical protein
MDRFEIDLDSECVWLDDAWLNRDDLVAKIKAMMDSGNYQIARPSSALEALTKALAQARLLALRISPEMSEALNAASLQTGRPVGAIAREAIGAWLASAANSQDAAQPSAQPSQAEPAEPQPAAEKVAPPNPAQAIALAVEANDASQTIVSEPVSAEEAAGAVALTPKHSDEADDVEKRWFDK